MISIWPVLSAPGIRVGRGGSVRSVHTVKNRRVDIFGIDNFAPYRVLRWALGRGRVVMCRPRKGGVSVSENVQGDNLVNQLELFVGHCYIRLWELVDADRYDQAGQLVDIMCRLGVV